jgi:GDP-4-dehydro-6-deoxy-D-mannose reductase
MVKSILVTGATGFLGRHVVRDLLRRGFKVEAKSRADGDVCDAETWKKFPATDCVIHLAGSTFVPDSWDDPSKFLQNNTLGTSLALDFCRNHKAKFVFFSTYMYSREAVMPVSEDSKLRPSNPYSLSKFFGENLSKFYSEHFGVKAVIFRPFNVYGLGQSEKFLIPSIIRQARLSDVIEVQDTKPSRDYVYVEDLLAALNCAITTDIELEVVNIGTGRSYSVIELIETLGIVSNRKYQIRSAMIERQSEIMHTQADNSRAREILNWEPQWSLKSGLKVLWNNDLGINFES